MPEDRKGLDAALKTIQAVSVVVGIVVSVLSFNAAREKDSVARGLEARKPCLDLRQKRYSEAEVQVARKRFRELYIAELSMVEAPEVEQSMVQLAKIVDPSLMVFTPAQKAAYDLSHALRDSFVADWGVDRK